MRRMTRSTRSTRSTGSTGSTGPSAARFRWTVIGTFLLAVALLAALGVGSAEVLSAVRAYVGGESLWSKGQKDAVYHLTRYARSHDPEDHRLYAAAIAVPLGDQRARIELERAQPDREVARRGFLDGGIAQEDVDSMIWLFRSFRSVPFMADAVATWAEADEQILVLATLGDQIHSHVRSGETVSPAYAALLMRLPLLNQRLTVLAQRFSATMGSASRQTQQLVQRATLLLAIGLAACAMLISLRLFRRQARHAQALRASEERVQRALESTALCLWDCNVRTGEVYLSEHWSRHRGGPAQATHTTTAALFDCVPESERQGLRDAFYAALTDPAVHYRVEHRVLRMDGSTMWVLSEGRVVERNARGVALRIVGTNRDITEHKEDEAARLKLEAQLRESQKMQAVGTLAGGIAHDFNNILGAVLGQLALLRDDVGPHHAALQGLERIDRSARRARRLVHQILAFSRRETQLLASRPLRPLLEETFALLRSTLPAGVQLDARLGDDESLHVLADSTQIQQVLMNLCTNAWHALQGRPGRIELGLRQAHLTADSAQRPPALADGDYAHIWVSDSGCGIDAATRSRIFEPFFTTKAVGQGTGLGLSVVHGIVASHGGAIHVASEPGQGSSFHVYLPLVPPPSAEVYSDWGTLAPLAETRTTGRGCHVMVVDDDEVMTEVMGELLQRMDYRVTRHLDPQCALAEVRKSPLAIDLVLSDFNMPGCSGLDLARELAIIRPDLPLVISSGNLSEAQREALLSAGVCAVVQKENAIDELGPLLQRLLAGRAVAL